MISKRVTKVGLVAAMTVAPFHANATLVSAQEGMDACAAAMVAELAANQGAPMVYNLDPESKSTGKLKNRREVFHLDALDPESQEVVARVDCVVDSRARVQKLIAVPLDAPAARMRATQAK